MVTFIIDSKDDAKVVYRYYPENHMDSAFGLIGVNLENGNITLDVVAEEDFLCRTSANELNEMRDVINEMRIENGEPSLTEEEWPTAIEADEWYYYADHVIHRLRDEIEKRNIPDKGVVVWY